MALLENGTVCLRALEPGDVELLYAWENDPAVWHLSSTLVPFSRHILRQYLDQAAQDIFTQKQLRLVICLRTDLRPLGTIDLFEFEPHHKRAGVGILIAEPADRGKGYARDALDALIAYAFSVLDLRQLHCQIAPENEASLSLFQKAGFRVTGRLEQWYNVDGAYRDMLFLQLLRSDS
ncbi:MAG: GNAT family protein [Bacteroidales bacterium]